MPCSSVAPTIAVHNTKRRGGGQCYHEGHSEVVNDDSNLLIPVVVRENDSLIFPGVVARELGSFYPVQVGEVSALDIRWIAASLDVDEQNSLVHLRHCLRADQTLIRGLVERTRCVVPYVDMCTVVHITRATLPARAPCAVEQTRQVFLPGCYTSDGLRYEISY